MEFGGKSISPRIVIKAGLWVLIIALSIASTRVLFTQARASLAFEYSSAEDRFFVAPKLDPGVADYARARGDFWLERAIPPRPGLAAFEYRRALELDPREAFHWSDWARVCLQLGRNNEAERAFEVATRLDSFNSVIQGEYGDYLLSEGRTREAAEHHAQAIRLDPRLARGLYSVYWTTGESALSVARSLLGDNPTLIRQYFIDCLTWVDTETARLLWDEFQPTEGALDGRSHKAYFDFLKAHGEYAAAKDLWHQIAKKFYGVDWNEGKQAFWNGDFELPPTFDGGLEWQILRNPPNGTRAILSPTKGREKDNCLWIHFEGRENVTFSHVRHLLFVEPGARYTLSYEASALDLTTDSQPYVRVTFPGKPGVRFSGDMVKGAGSWAMKQEFTVPDDCRMAEVAICRDPIRKLNSRIEGDAWYDNFVLEPAAQSTTGTLTP